MSVTTHTMTADDLAAMSPRIGRAELVKGELICMSPAGFEHGKLTTRLSWRIAQHVEETGLGVICAAETGFLLKRNPDTVRAPDIAFVAQSRLDLAGSVRSYWPGCPDLVAEIISPSDTFSEVEAKALEWLEAGCMVVWIVDPKQKHITEYRSSTEIRILTENDILTAPELLGDWSMGVEQLFQ